MSADDLGLRVTRCKAFRWQRGMAVEEGIVMGMAWEASGLGSLLVEVKGAAAVRRAEGCALDVDHPANVGFLWAVLKESGKESDLTPAGVRVWHRSGVNGFPAYTEQMGIDESIGHALCRAIIAASEGAS